MDYEKSFYSNKNRDDLIACQEDFFKKYPNFNIDYYKIFNNHLRYKKDIDYEKDYTINGINTISCKQIFYKLYPEFNMEYYKLFNYNSNFINDIEYEKDYHFSDKNKIACKDDFYKIYPRFDLNFYKLFNEDIKFEKDIEYEKDYHLVGYKKNRISNKGDLFNNINNIVHSESSKPMRKAIDLTPLEPPQLRLREDGRAIKVDSIEINSNSLNLPPTPPSPPQHLVKSYSLNENTNLSDPDKSKRLEEVVNFSINTTTIYYINLDKTKKYESNKDLIELNEISESFNVSYSDKSDHVENLLESLENRKEEYDENYLAKQQNKNRNISTKNQSKINENNKSRMKNSENEKRRSDNEK
jgi:hypothetical protein